MSKNKIKVTKFHFTEKSESLEIEAYAFLAKLGLHTHMHTINGWINIEGFGELLVISFDDEAGHEIHKAI